MSARRPADATVGDHIGPFVRTPGFAEWNRFAAVNDEFVPIHMDDEAGREAGYPGAIGMGRLHWSYLHALLRDWLQGEGRIAALGIEFRGAQLRDATCRTQGRVTAVSEPGGERELVLDVWVEDAGGRVLTPGTARVVVPR